MLSCYMCNGHLDTVKWLYIISKTDNNIEIDISAEDNLAFMWTCRYGNVETAEWLYELSKINNNLINIHSLDEIFEYSCRYNTGIAELLCTLCDKYKIIYDDDGYLIPYILNLKTVYKTESQKKSKNILIISYVRKKAIV